MASEDPFEPKLGRMRAQTPKAPKTYRGKVLQAANRAGAGSRARKGSYGGGKYSRGASAARVLSGTASKGPRQRRVVVKTRFVKLAGKGMRAAAAHLRYLQRDGVTRDGQKGELYGAELDAVDAKDFMARCDEDRHQFRFIVAPEDADQYDSLKSLTRKVMSQMEQDLGTRLDWVAVDHFNTGHPHTHIVIRGMDDLRKDLVISREYLSEGFRERVQAQVTLDLGPRSDLEIRASRQAEIGRERLTSIDRQFLREMDASGRVQAGHPDPFSHSVRAGRLAQLERFGLATPVGEGAWQLRSDLALTLRRMGERGDIIKTLHSVLKDRGLEAALPDAAIHEADRVQNGGEGVLTGRLVSRGLSDEYTDRHFLILEATDGRVHYVDIGEGARLDPIRAGAILRLAPNIPDVRPVDLTIAKIAGQNAGLYDVDAHLRIDRSARQEFAETHLRRLEAIRRVTGGVDREPDGRFRVGDDYVEKALAYEAEQARRSPVKVDVLSDRSLADQITYPGVTWLDTALAAENAAAYAYAGFGKEVRSAQGARLQWLVEEGLATVSSGGVTSLHPEHLPTLQRRELAAAADQVSRELGLSYVPARSGEQIEGTLRKGITLGSGKFAVIDRGRDFTLVPWRPVLEKQIDKTVSGLVREKGINWTIGRSRGLERD